MGRPENHVQAGACPTFAIGRLEAGIVMLGIGIEKVRSGIDRFMHKNSKSPPCFVEAERSRDLNLLLLDCSAGAHRLKFFAVDFLFHRLFGDKGRLDSSRTQHQGKA